MPEDYELVRADFNEIAALADEPKWNHNNCYYPLLMRLLPPGAGTCLEIGCGKGELSLLLAEKCQKVVAVDLAEEMIRQARSRRSAENIQYVRANILDLSFPPGSLDLIVSSATAHHLPCDWLLAFAKETLRPGGRLLLLDLVRAQTAGDYLFWGGAALPNIAMNLFRNGKLRKDDPRARQVWAKHGRHDHYMTLGEIRARAAAILPGARVRRLLYWRYLLVWTKQ